MSRMLAAIIVLLLGLPAFAGDYRIRAGDMLRIEVFEDTSLNRSVLVTPDGQISFPFAGTIKASGLTVTQIEAAVTNGIAANFAMPPSVFVAVTETVRSTERSGGQPTTASVIRVFFLGEFAGAGAKDMAPGTTLLQALAMGGGFTKFAATKRIQLRRRDPETGKESILSFNYAALSRGKGQGQDVILQAGDVVLAPERRLFE